MVQVVVEGWAAYFSQPTLLGIHVGLTIESLAQPAVTATQALCPVLRVSSKSQGVSHVKIEGGGYG